MIKTIAIRGGAVLVIIGLWWIIAATHFFNPLILATPSAVVQAARDTHSQVLQALGVTLREVLVAIGIAWLGGLLFGTLFGLVRLLYPFLGLARAAFAMPIIIVYPIFTVWFGFGSSSKIVFGAFAGLVPMVLMTATAMGTVAPNIFVLMRSMGASRRETIVKGVLPASLPGVLGALRLSGSLALVGVIVGEMLSSQAGIGYFIANAGTGFQTPDVYLGIIAVIALALLFQVLLRLFEVALFKLGDYDFQ